MAVQLSRYQLVEHIALARGVHHRYQLVEASSRALAHGNIEKHLIVCGGVRATPAFGRRARRVTGGASTILLFGLWHMSGFT